MTAAAAIDLTRAGTVVIASPHGSETGVYARPGGNLDGFGPRGISAEATGNADFAHALAERWGRPVLDGPADHGIVVPLRLLGTDGVAVVAVTFAEGLDAEGAAAEAGRLASALGAVETGFSFVASANTSAGLDERAPLPSLPGAREAESAVLEALRDDPAALVPGLPALARAGSCAAGPLAAFARLGAGRRCELVAYEHPFGVGYPVAVTA